MNLLEITKSLYALRKPLKYSEKYCIIIVSFNAIMDMERTDHTWL